MNVCANWNHYLCCHHVSGPSFRYPTTLPVFATSVSRWHLFDAEAQSTNFRDSLCYCKGAGKPFRWYGAIIILKKGNLASRVFARFAVLRT